MTRAEGRLTAMSETTQLRLIVDNARPGFHVEIRETLEALGVNFSRVHPLIESHRFDYLLAEIDNADDKLRGSVDDRPALATPWVPTPI